MSTRRPKASDAAPPDMTVRVGCRLVYEAPLPTPILLLIRPRLERPHRILREKLSIPSVRKSDAARDANGNITHRWTLPPGRTTIVHDALVEISSRPDNFEPKTHSVPVAELSLDILRYTLPSRYCDSDKMLRFAATQFGHLINGIDRVIAICNWTHRNIRYVTCSGRPDLSASEVMARGYGVCRDFAHVAIALCRAVNLPARYVSGHMPDIGFRDAGGAMDFHAYFEVYLEHQWRPFDARFNIPRIGRIKISHGLDAVDGSFATTYGEAQLTFFEVWAYQVKPGTVSLGDPIDLSKRLDGTPRIRFR